MIVRFDELPDDARLWIFNAERPLTAEETTRLRMMLEGFVSDWASHRKDLTAGYDVRYNQFVLIGVDESKLPPSGCSIDSLVTSLKSIGGALGVELVDSPDVPFRIGEAIRCVDRSEFARLAEQGEVNTATIVFDRTAPRLGDLRAGRWERPAGETWHGRAFSLREE